MPPKRRIPYEQRCVACGAARPADSQGFDLVLPWDWDIHRVHDAAHGYRNLLTCSMWCRLAAGLDSWKDV